MLRLLAALASAGPLPIGAAAGGRGSLQCADADSRCELYSQKPLLCTEPRKDGFVQSECCMCKHWLQRPLPAENCSNTDQGRVGFAGYACGLYKNKPRFCGMGDTKEFKALEMCCECQTFTGGGGHNGPVCPRSARNTVPDGEGLCHCSEGWGCVEGGGGAGSGCPAAGGRRPASFDVGCANCACSRQEGMLEKDASPCYGALEDDLKEDLTPEAWIVSLAMNSVLERLQSLLWATRDVHAMWFEHSDPLELAEESEVATNDRLLRSWARILFKAAVRSNFAAQSCGVVFGGGKGGFVGVYSGGCEAPNEPVLLRSLNGEALKSFKLRGAGCKMEDALSGTWSCDPTAMWIEGWTANETRHVKVDGDQQREVVGPYVASEEPWGESVWLRTMDFELLGHYSSHITRVGVTAFGVWLRTLGQPTLVRCEMTSEHLSDVVATLVPVNARMFIMTGAGSLLASSHGDVELQGSGLLKRSLHYSENQDPVVRHVGLMVHTKLRNGTVPPNMTEPWPEKLVRLQIYVQRNLGIDATVILVNPPQCEPGMELLPGEDWKGDDEGWQNASACQRCSVGKKSELGAKMGELCVNCSQGSYGRLESSTTCFTCEVGKYQDRAGATDCKPCAENRTSHPGAKSMWDCHCKEHFYSLSDDMDLACRPCPPGAYCAGNESLPMALPMHFSLGPEAVVRCVPTLTGTSCLGGQGGEDLVRVPAQPPYDEKIVNYCDTGYDGIACSYCTEGYYRFGRDCIKCVEGTDKTIVVAFLFLMMLFYLLRRVVNSRYKTLYIFMTFLQVFSIQGSFPMKWPVSARHVMRVLQMANLQVDLLLPFCDAQRNFPFFYQFAGTLVLPWFFLLVDLTIITFQRACTKRKEARHSGFGITSSAREAALAQIAGLRERSTRDLVIDFLAQAVLNFRLMYLSLCGRTFDMLRCTNFSERHSRLSMDLHFMCWEGEHAAYMPLVFFAMIFHVIGTPLAYAVIMVKGYKGNLLYSQEHVRRYGVLYSRFEPPYFYWELVIIARRFLCVVIKTSMNIRKAQVQELGYVGNYQAALVAFVMLLSLVVHFYARPFANPWQDFGDAVYMFGTFASCIIGLCFSAARTDAERLAFEVLFHVNLYLVFLVTFLLIWRDVEAEHPSVLRRRQALFERLGLDRMRKAPSRWLRRRLTGQHSVAFVDAVEDLALAALPAEDTWVPGMEALHGLALYEKLRAAGLEVPRKQISVSVSVLEKDSFEVLSIVAPPFGITTLECEEALQGSRQLQVLREFAEPLLTVCGALPVPAGPRRAEARELVPGVRWSQLAEVPPLLAGLKSMLETAIYEESAGRGLPLPRGCLELTLSQGEAPDSLQVSAAVAVPEELEVDAVQAMLSSVSHEELVRSFARSLAEACGGVLPPHQSMPCVMMPRTPKVEAC